MPIKLYTVRQDHQALNHLSLSFKRIKNNKKIPSVSLKVSISETLHFEYIMTLGTPYLLVPKNFIKNPTDKYKFL